MPGFWMVEHQLVLPVLYCKSVNVSKPLYENILTIQVKGLMICA